MTPAEVRARLLRFLRRMPCDVAYNVRGFAFYTKCSTREVRAAIASLEAAGVVTPILTATRPPFYEPTRAACVPGKRCKRPACRLHREAKRLAALADKVAAS